MDRIQRALDLAKSQRVHHAAQAASMAVPNPDEARAERLALNREFSLSTIESLSRLTVDWQALSEKRVLSPRDAHQAGAAYRMLRTQILQRARAHGLSTLGVVSAVNGEGKTLTAINLALNLAAEPNQSL